MMGTMTPDKIAMTSAQTSSEMDIYQVFLLWYPLARVEVD